MRRSIATVGVALLAGAMVLIGVSPASAQSKPDTNAAPQADDALSQHRSAIRAADGEAYTVYRSTVDADGATHVRYTRTYQGLRVYGGDFIVHAAPDGSFAGASVGLSAPLSLSTTAKVPAARAQQVARAQFSGQVTKVGAAELFIDATSGFGRLAWETVVEGWAADGQTPSRLHVHTDAVTGEFLRSYDEIKTVNGTGHSVYAGTVTISTTQSGSSFTLTDPTHGNGNTCDMNNGTSTCSTMSDADNVWGNGSPSNDQSAAVDAHYGAALTYDYFTNVHNRNGIFGNGSGVPSRVHYGNNYVNAFWDGSRMTYGDGSGNANPLVSIDVAGHEMSHGVTENVVPGGLTYSG